MNLNEVKIYQLFQFSTPDDVGNKEIDFVYKGWIHYDELKCQLVTFYPPPPYSKKVWDVFNSMVKSQLPPHPDWPTYPIDLKGHAGKINKYIYKYILIKVNKNEINIIYFSSYL